MIKRVVTSLLLLVATSIFVFVVLRLLPGDPVLTRLGEQSSVDAETIARLRREVGLDDSIVVQYVNWVGGLFRGDLGESYFSQYSVTSMIGSRLGPTIELTVAAMTLTVLIAVPLAIVAALEPGGAVDRAIAAATSVGMAVPQFLLGVVLILVFSLQLGLLPARGFVPFSEDPLGNLQHLVLPAFTLALVSAPILLRFLRASMFEALRSSYVRTAEGKGVRHRRVITGHVLRNALIPALTVLGLMVGHTLGGVVIVEYVFGFSGLGSLAVESVSKRDYAVLQSVVLLISAMFIFASCAVDILYGMLDPRLRVRSGRG